MTLAAARADLTAVRLRSILLLVLALPVFAGCSGADAGRAQLLLKQAQVAQSAVSSEAFSMHVTVEAKDQKVQVALSGGAYLKGSRAGDMVMDAKLSAPVALPFDTVRIEKVGPTAWMEMNGRRTDLPAATGATMQSSTIGAFDFTRYVKDVKVSGGQLLEGKPVTKIVGILDTAALIQGIAKLGNVAGSAGLPGLGGKVGDTRVVIFIDDTTHLLVAALADVTMNGDSGNLTLHLDLAISGVDRPVAALTTA
jgi:hypothetical protein